jgi:hypothetical protein
MGQLDEGTEVHVEDEDDLQDRDELTEARKLLYRFAMQEDPAELRRAAQRHLADFLSPAAVRSLSKTDLGEARS